MQSSVDGSATFPKDITCAGHISSNYIHASDINQNGTSLDSFLAQRERKLTAAEPCLKIIDASGGISLSIDESKSLVADAFQSGKFRMRSSGPEAMEFQRFDDDGVSVSDAWQIISQLRSDETLGATLHVNQMRSKSDAEIVMQDSLRVEAGLHIVENITCSGSVKSPFWVAGNVNKAGQGLVEKGATYHVSLCGFRRWLGT